MSDRIDAVGPAVPGGSEQPADERTFGLRPSAWEAPLPNARPLTIAHDYFTQRGGAERVAAALIDALLPDRVVTAVVTPEHTFPLPAGQVETTMLQQSELFRSDPRRALPLFPLAWSRVPPVTAGVVICSSSGWSHGIPVTGNARKIVYCHNPARWLYQPDDYFREQPKVLRATMRLLAPLLAHWDRAAAATADVYIANSSSVAERIRTVYGREAVVIHPPVTIDPAGERVPVAGQRPGYFLTVGRGRGYKNLDRLVAAFAELPAERLVVVGEPPRGVDLPSNVSVVHDVSDAELRWLYANARALLSVSHEDFGLTPLEANVFGTPALLVRAGGFLDSLDEGVSGRFLDDDTPAGIAAAVRAFPKRWDSAAIVAHAQDFSLEAFVGRLRQVVDLLLAD
ncbi:glycosyltransferase [Amnibacterium sp. CER49]|uniref:glycosyltransferase n=1 Tax=Amnibacterium sp. CER49 TaxID=3039161 RepID=UPI00244C695C|nr:glycosyltransferase [Amnibacterium sp. CER49]MDH2443038.1 glycosyltransferase [Amnibacterium sp. CER49]